MKKLLNIVSDKQQLNESIEGYGMPMPGQIPTAPVTPPVSMTVSMNAQGIDQIKDLLSLMNKAESPLGPGPVGMPPSMPPMPEPKVSAPLSIGAPDIPSNPMPAAKEPGMADLIKMVGEPSSEKDATDKPEGEPVDGKPAPKKEMQAVADEVRSMTDELANAPDEQIAGLDAAIPSGDDLHKEKGAYKKVAGGDNPMALEQLKADLSRLYKTVKESM